MPTIRLPHNYVPRPYQRNALRALDNGATRAVLVWHRRAGKQKTLINYVAKRAFHRVGGYFHLFPTYAQAKKAVWDGRDGDGFPFIGHFPPQIIKAKREDELKVTFVNGSIYQLVGSDHIDALMSTNPIGCVFDEYSLQDPRGWEYLRPILRENGGWAAFGYTPRGKNHGYQLYEMARKLQAEGDPAWFAERLTIDDTGVLSEADMEAERREGMDEEMIQQEYYCSFAGAQQGSIFGRQMDEVDREGRICGVPWERDLPVSTWWDIGTGDATAIWFTQDVGREVHVIDYYENSGTGVGIDHYIKHLQGLPYVWGTHNGPHDLRAHSFASGGKSAMEVANALGFRFVVVPKVDKQDGINAARAFLSRCWFDRAKTERGRLALISYHRTWDERRHSYSTEAYHDWSSNGCFAGETEVLTRHGTCPIMHLPKDGEVLTRCGYKRYEGPFLTKTNARLVEVVFRDGLTVRCTPEHLFATASGWKSAECLQPGTSIQSFSTQLLNILRGDYIVQALVRDIIRVARGCCTGTRGLLRSALYLLDVTFTTAGEASSTIGLSTSYAYQPPSISQSPQLKGMRPEDSRPSRMQLEPPLRFGTGQKQVGYGTVGKLLGLNRGLNGGENHWFALRVGSNLWGSFAKVVARKSTVHRIARRPIIEGVNYIPLTADVWDITVPDGGEFCLANGAVVHNSDAFRYLAVGHKTATARRREDEPRRLVQALTEAGTSWLGA